MQCRTTAHTVVAILIVAVDLIGVIEHGSLKSDMDAIAQITQTRLHKEATVGVRAKGDQLARFRLKMETTLVDFESSITAGTTNDLA